MKLIYNRKPTKEEIERLQDKRIRYRYFDCNDSKRLFTKIYPFDLNLYIEKYNCCTDTHYTWIIGYHPRRRTAEFINYCSLNEIVINPPLVNDGKNDKPYYTIGFSRKTNKWYGWDWEDIQEFNIGHMVKKGDMGYTPNNIDELYQDLLKQYTDNAYVMKYDEHISIKELVSVIEGITKNNDYICSKYWSKPYNVYLGRGEWQAKTLDDCKEMAVDFVRAIRRKKYNELYI